MYFNPNSFKKYCFKYFVFLFVSKNNLQWMSESEIKFDSVGCQFEYSVRRDLGKHHFNNYYSMTIIEMRCQSYFIRVHT